MRRHVIDHVIDTVIDVIDPDIDVIDPDIIDPPRFKVGFFGSSRNGRVPTMMGKHVILTAS